MRCCSGLLLLGLFVGCTNTNEPNVSDTNSVSPPHSVNKPVVNDNTTLPNTGASNQNQSIDANDKPSFDRGPDEATPPTNTAINERDQKDTAKTPFDQSNKNTDIQLTANIRQKIVNHEGMSINARNVKIVADGGRVTLRGPVNSQEEKDLVGQLAKDVAGENNIDNQLEVAADKGKADANKPDAVDNAPKSGNDDIDANK